MVVGGRILYCCVFRNTEKGCGLPFSILLIHVSSPESEPHKSIILNTMLDSQDSKIPGFSIFMVSNEKIQHEGV